jgi:CHAT domain-containing protein
MVLGLVSLPVLGAENIDSLFRQAETYLQQGQYHLALDDLKTTQPLAATPLQKAQVSGLLGLVHYRMHHYPQADTLLQAAVASTLGIPIDRARWQIALAALKADQGDTDQARHLYTNALKLAVGDSGLSVAIKLGQAQLLPTEQRLAELQRIAPVLTTITPVAARVPHLINIATQAGDIRASIKPDKTAPKTDGQQQLSNASLKLAYQSLGQAKSAVSAQQPRLWAEISGSLAQLYEEEHRIDEALYLNGQAGQSARQVQADDLLLDVEWRQGRLYRAKNNYPEAIAAYERAVEHIEAIRQDIPVAYHNGRSSFRETLEPVYLGLADLLLLEADKQTGAGKDHMLHRARDAVELIKQSELADFLGGRCAITSVNAAKLDSVATGTAVLYPIILPDRLELLVSFGSEVQHYVQPISVQDLEGDILSMAHSLRNKTDLAGRYSRKFYEQLIAPIQSSLQQHRIQTLVWVPDGMLRLVSPAAFYDGEHYLIEKYTVVTSPGLSLFDPSPMPQGNIQALLAGMSKPGPVVGHLPGAWVNGINENNLRGIAPRQTGSRGLPVVQGMDKTRHGNSEGLARTATREQDLKNLLSLPGVEQEMNSLKGGMPNTLLMNETFTVDNFKNQLLQQPFSVVHIASHGVFGSTADNSFVMAYDDLITMDQLERLLKADKFIKQPVQLLTLSACQTAEGDDRAPLGFSGLAIKSKVRSALGTLWPVDDKAASQLMAEFYKNLSKPGVNKAQALQQAQLTLLKQKHLNHPYYWSPFILVGNWL